MTARPGPYTIELTQDEILEDLFWPHPSPGEWHLEPESPGPVPGRGRSGQQRSSQLGDRLARLAQRETVLSPQTQE
jgi:hypothetical protein